MKYLVDHGQGNFVELEVGEEYRFYDIFNGHGDAEELLESGSVAVWDDEEEEEVVAEFEIVEQAEDYMDTMVRILWIG